MRKNDHVYLVGYTAAASALVMLIVLSQYYRYRMFGTTLLLGWDSPAYVWMAKYVIANGPINMAYAWSYPNLYSQLLAFFGYLTGNIVMIERILPLLFCVLLIYVNSELVFRITKHIHIAGLTAFLAALSVNVLRVLSDLHRNLMALSLSFIVLLLIPNLDDETSLLNKRYLSILLILLVIAATQFETYFVLSMCLVLYGFLTRNLKKIITLTFACAIPVAILVLLFPAYFLGYLGTVVFFERRLTVGEVLLWAGGSWLLLGFLIVGFFFFFKSKLWNDKLGSLIFSWCLAILLIVTSIGSKLIPLSPDFAYRAFILMPIPVLLALATSGCNDFIKRWQSKHSVSSTKKKRSIHQLLLFLIASCLIINSALVVVQHAGGFLTPYVPRSGYEKILATKEFFAENSLSNPVVVFRGYPTIWFVTLYRNYIGAELGEHFAYYGDIENLLRLIPSEPKIDFDPYLSQLERYYITFFFDELMRDFSGPPPPMYVHDSHITSVEDLMSHPIVVVAPEFYNYKIPYFLKPFYVSEGIYVIPSNSSINPSEITYGPEVTVIKNGTPTQVNSTYTHIDPYDPSIAYLKINASSGYASYNFTNFPSNWTFQRIEQGSDISFPEVDPRRINGTKAYSGNDPADSMNYWSSPVPEQNGTFEIDALSKKEGVASLKVSGNTDSYGCLTVRYDGPGTWNLAGYSSIGVWVKCNESALFSVTLTDCYKGSRTFWAIEAGGGSATTGWKRFVANLTEYTSQTPGFSINSVDRIDLYVYSTVGKRLSFWVDDLTIDTALDLEKFVYKDRVPVDETVVIYFYVTMESSGISTEKMISFLESNLR